MFHLLFSNFRTSFTHGFVTACITMVAACLLMSGCKTGKVLTTRSGLQYTILKKGTRPGAKAGQEIMLFETTSYRNGTVLYSNENSTTPVKVLIGGNQATQAVDEALKGMRVGEVKKIIAPPHLVKRKSYPSNVHPDSTLVIKMILHKIL